MFINSWEFDLGKYNLIFVIVYEVVIVWWSMMSMKEWCGYKGVIMFYFDILVMFVVVMLMLLFGCKLVYFVFFLKKYIILEFVVGGLLVVLVLLVLKKSMGWEVNFDMFLCDLLMLVFFVIIGLNVNIVSLCVGGCVVGIFLIVVVGLLVM